MVCLEKKTLTAVEQCFGCNKFFTQKYSLENHQKNCSGIVCKFENNNVQTFHDNVKFMGEVSFAISFDYEATSGKKTYNLDQDTKLFDWGNASLF